MNRKITIQSENSHEPLVLWTLGRSKEHLDCDYQILTSSPHSASSSIPSSQLSPLGGPPEGLQCGPIVPESCQLCLLFSKLCFDSRFITEPKQASLKRCYSCLSSDFWNTVLMERFTMTLIRANYIYISIYIYIFSFMVVVFCSMLWSSGNLTLKLKKKR